MPTEAPRRDKALLIARGIAFVEREDGAIFQIPAGGRDGDDALNTAIDAAIAPAPAAPAVPTAPSTPAAPAADAAPSTPAASAAPDASAQELAAFKALGLSPAQVAEIATRDKQVQAAIKQMETEERAAAERTPEGVKRARQREAFAELARETGLDPDAIRVLLARDREVQAETAAARTREARDTFHTEMGKLGISYPDSPDGKAAAKQDEDLVAGVLQSNDDLNAMYFNPATRTEAVARASSMVAGVVNRHLIAQGAADLRAAAARRSSVPFRGVGSSLATATDAVPKWTGDRRAYLTASRAAASSLLDEVLATQQ